MNLAGKTFVLTGAGGGIGTAIADALASEKVKLVLVDRNADKLAAMLLALRGGGHSSVQADLTVAADRDRLRDHCEALNNGVDGVINNAGLSSFTAFEGMDAALIEATIAVNVTAPILLTQALLPLLRQRPQAMVVNTGSTFGSIGYPGFAVYSASKFGLRGFSEALGRELADSNVDVLYFAPRATKTAINSDATVEMNAALGSKMDSPELVAEELVSAIRKGKKHHHVGWPEKLFVRVNGMFPSIVDKSIRKQLHIIKQFLNK